MTYKGKYEYCRLATSHDTNIMSETSVLGGCWKVLLFGGSQHHCGQCFLALYPGLVSALGSWRRNVGLLAMLLLLSLVTDNEILASDCGICESCVLSERAVLLAGRKSSVCL